MTKIESIHTKTAEITSQDADQSSLAALTHAAPHVVAEISSASKAVADGLILSENSTRVAVAQIKTLPGQIERNTEKIIASIASARDAGAKLVVFPELTIPGYASLDLFFNPQYIAANLEALQKIRAASLGITVVVGYAEPAPDGARPGGRPLLYNSAAVIHDGKVVGTQSKSLLPNYEIFFEDRYFAPAQQRRVIEAGGMRLGIEICEDLWSADYPIDPTDELARQSPDLIVNLSASPFHIGKLPVRAGLVEKAAQRSGKPFIYANLVGGFDGYEGEVLFDGRSFVTSRSGELAGIARGFGEDLLLVDIAQPRAIELPTVREVAELHDALVMGIKDYFIRRTIARGGTMPRAVIGLSGGIDSALVAALCVEALGKENVFGITMPSKYSSTETKSDALLVAENLGIACKTIPIEQAYNTTLDSLRSDQEFAERAEDVTEENLQARLRMVLLMAQANKLGAMMVNTGNKTELILNNCTIYGDMSGGFSPLGDVDKDRVYALARYINERAEREVIPRATIERVPSAELKPNQSDAQVMGDHPQLLAPMAREIFENGLSVTEAIERFKDQYPADLIRRLFTRMDDFEWKSRQMPPALRVTPHAYGVGRRFPMNHGFYR
jgi:NAD+ synthase (glutamine-hydrolysing)